MQLFFKQLPIVIESLNIGFLQTLKLFFVTLLGALPLGLLIAHGSMSRVKPISALTRPPLPSSSITRAIFPRYIAAA